MSFNGMVFNSFRLSTFLSFFLLILFLKQSVIVIAESPIKMLLYQQYAAFPQEKIYVQTDKKNYIIGEDVWFRAYLVNAQSHFSDTTSRYIYAELINPFMEVVKRIKVRLENGVYCGYIPLTEELATSDYTLRFYTKYMENLGEEEEYFFARIIHVDAPKSTFHSIISTFSYEEII
jgi:hypothetical protein